MSHAIETYAQWLADYYLLSTVLLALTLIAVALLKQPSQRLAVIKSMLVALVLLAILCAIPGWSVVHLLTAEQTNPIVDSSPAVSTAPEIASIRSPRIDIDPTSLNRANSAPPLPQGEGRGEGAFKWSDISWPAAFATIHLSGAACILGWLILGWFASARLRRTAKPAPSDLLALLYEIAEKHAPRPQRVQLLTHDRIEVAVALGIWRPAILLPEHWLHHLPLPVREGPGEGSKQNDLRTILAHEATHIQNRDLHWLAVNRALLILFWPQPLYWLTRRHLRLDQESLADAAAAELTSRQQYAAQLVTWARTIAGATAGSSSSARRPALNLSSAVGLWERPSQLRQRVAILLNDRITILRNCSRRWRLAAAMLATGAALLLSMVTFQPATRANEKPTALNKMPNGQQMLPLPVRVMDANGKPVANAKVTPWALRSSQGDGLWEKNDKRAGVGPTAVVTDKDGIATVLYPKYRDAREKTRTLGISLSIDHPNFAYIDAERMDVPLETKGPHEIKLDHGVPLEIRPLVNGKPAALHGLFALWSDGRSRQSGAAAEKLPNGMLRIPAMPPGKNSVLLVKLEGERATYFSKITDFELKQGEPKKIDIPLLPSLRIEGVLSDNVPRPVRHGRIKIVTLRPARSDRRVDWLSWTPIRPDGTFTIDGWPAGERMQLIALCDGYIATSGQAPDVVKNPPNPENDSFGRPQVFEPRSDKRIEVPMTPLVPCVVTTVDQNGAPIPKVNVGSYPNVGWWNYGSQIYCAQLVRGERLLRVRDYYAAVDEDYPQPFKGKTDAHGKLALELPAGREDLWAGNDDYELPAFLGDREVRVKLVQGEITRITLHLQPRGTDKLGEWDKLAGVVFGCSTREGRRICALPGVRKKMDKFEEQFREGKNQHDPKLLAEAYSAVADAFVDAGDQQEAAKWRQKAAEEAAKAKGAETARKSSKSE